MNGDPVAFRIDKEGPETVGADGMCILDDLASVLLCHFYRVPNSAIDIKVDQNSPVF